MQEVFNQDNPNTSSKALVKNILQSSLTLFATSSDDNSSFEDTTTVLKKAKQILYPSFFSSEGLAQDILELTQAEPDVPLNVFIGLYSLRENSALKDSLRNLFGTSVQKGILHSPENLMGDQDPADLLSLLPQQEETIFERFKELLMGIESLEEEIMSLDDIDEKDVILMSLKDVRAFYIGYKTKILQICKAINEKEKSEKDGIAELTSLLKPKATMFGEFFPNGQAYRISRKIARHLLSLNHHGTSLTKDPKASANHRVSYLPFHESTEIKATPRVFFKANGLPSLQPGKEAMLCSLYRLLNIPVPRTGLLVITGTSDIDPAFYTVQASEAVMGHSPKADTSWKEELKFDTKKFESFCQQVVGVILTNPSDGKPANFIYHKEKYGLVSIDNDEVFYNDFSASNKKDFEIRTKSLLLCFEAMDQPIPASFSNFLMNIDPQLLILAWLDELDLKNQNYQDLGSVLCFESARQNFQKTLPNESSCSLEELLKKQIPFNPPAENFLDSLSLPITVSTNLLESLKNKLSQIAQSLSGNCTMMTPQKLLEKISPHLGTYYKNLRNKFPDSLKAIKAIRSLPYSRASSLILSQVKMSLLWRFRKTLALEEVVAIFKMLFSTSIV